MLNPTYSPAGKATNGSGGSKTLGVCVPDPEGVESLCESLAHVEGSEVMVVQDTAAALDQAFQGKLDALVVLPSGMTAEALTALSFLQEVRPEIMLYAVEETHASPAFRLCPLANFLTRGDGEPLL